jgi:hypothetical protein
MKKMKFLLLPILFGMFLASCNSTPAAPKKASIKIETNQYMTTSLEEGEYDLNKAIEFTVSALNEEYSVTSVKMDDTELPPVNNTNKYTFTPTEEKEYKLKVTTSELDNVIVYTFNNLSESTYAQQLTKKGVKLNVDNREASFQDLFKNGNLTLANGQKIVFLFNSTSYTKRVLVNKIKFTFASGKENLSLNKPTPKEEYVDGVYTYKSEVFDEDRADLLFNAGGNVAISKIVVETVPYVPFKIKLQFNNLGSNDKVYFLSGPTFAEWEKKQEVTATSEFIALQAYYLYVQWGQDRKTYYDNLIIKYKGEPLKIFNFYPSDESGLPKDQIITYLLTPTKEDSKINVLDLEWVSKVATNSIKVDIESANRYVKGFMETDPIASLGLSNLYFGADASLAFNVKKGYNSLKMVVNNEVINKNQETEKYNFKVPYANPINISFTASEGDEDRVGKEVITLTGEDKDKGVILGEFKNEQLHLYFLQDDEHPTASISALSFKGKELEKKTAHDPEDGDTEYFLLSKDQTTEYKNATGDKSALFTATIVESGSYKSAIIFNKGAFKVEITGKEASEDDKYEVDGKSSVIVKITPNEFIDIFAVEVNDKRLTSGQYTLNQDGSINYTFNANAKNYEFLIQTKAQTVTLSLDSESTTGYRIKDLPANPVTCGQSLLLTLGVTDDAKYWLSGKKITVTYNGKEAQVSEVEGEFKFTIIPVKGASKIKVIVTDNPQ